MTKLDRQKAAVTMAVIKAVSEIGLETIKSDEFFGTQQRRTDDVRTAA